MILKWITSTIVIFLSTGFAIATPPADEVNSQRRIVVTDEASISIETAWNYWTTKEGLENFFAPEAFIDPKVDGNLSIYFYPDRAPGLRGAEEMKILAFEPMQRLSFTWNAPVVHGHARSQRTVVTVRFKALTEERTEIELTHDHFGEGYDWDDTFEFFSRAWSDQVMSYFVKAAETGEPVMFGKTSVEPSPVEVIH